MVNMTESEMSLLPSGVIRSQAEEFAGRFYAFLHLHLKEFLFVLIVIFIFLIFRKISFSVMAVRTKKIIPESTNTWFKWEDFEAWKKERN